jgi:asparagine synthase (glutamine-hydrolysing)
MCGIAGLIQNKNQIIEKESINLMITNLRHRGIDNEGCWIDQNIALGHTRLSIIDLSNKSLQPMKSNNSRYILVYNGEIYNYRELRSELEKNGFIFKSNGDTEVVLNSLIYWGKRALLKFNGMFALSLYDRATSKLIIARDRYGIKPLYYAILQDNSFVFASEEKAIKNLPNYQVKLDELALIEYFTFQNIFSDRTFYSGINLLNPGSFLEIDTDNLNPNLKPQTYWDFDFTGKNEVVNALEYEEQLAFLLSQSVRRQLVSDVEVGSYLSSGVDSGIVASFASEYNARLKTFTVGFDLSDITGTELGFDERNIANIISKEINTDHYEFEINVQHMESSIDELTFYLDTPRVGQSYPNLYAAKLASSKVKVVLSGTGGDEIFAGYPWRYYQGQPGLQFQDYVDSYYSSWQRLISDETKRDFFKPIWASVKDYDTREIFSKVLNQQQSEIIDESSFLNKALYLECKTFLHGLLNIEDKIHMANSIENRVPFLDNDVVDFAMSCPTNLKLKNLKKHFSIDENIIGDKKSIYYDNLKDGKIILRSIYKNKIGNLDKGLKKQGFTGPDSTWFKSQSASFIQNILLDKNCSIYDFIDFSTARELIHQHTSGVVNRRLLIWSLLSFNSWINYNL